MTEVSWTQEERRAALDQAERDGLDLLVIGGGITGAGVLREAASRGLRTLLVERDDFAGGTSSRSSKLIHGGLRYIAEGQLGITREACRERDLLQRLNPHLVRAIPFLFPAYEGQGHPLWHVRAALWTYTALANFRASSRFDMLTPDQVTGYSPGLLQTGLRGAGLYHDAQVDDARLVLEVLKSARRLGGEAANHAELVELLRGADGRLCGARVRDNLGGGLRTLRTHAIVNAAGPGVERVRGLGSRLLHPELRPAKGIHLVIPRTRVDTCCAVTFRASDGRQLFLVPWDEVAMIGTTDSFTREIDEPVATIEEVHYLLEAANEAFPRAALTTNDLQSVFAGVRPLVADPDEQTPASSVSREGRVYDDPSGLLSVAGGKLTTFRATGEKLVNRIVARLPGERRAAAKPSRTAELALRDDSFDRRELVDELTAEFELDANRVNALVRAHGAGAETLLRDAPSQWRQPIGSSRFLLAEIPWSFRTECPAGLCDLLERRMRLAILAVGQGLPQIEEIAAVAGEVAGWDSARVREEVAAYAGTIRRHYQIAPSDKERSAA